MDLEDETEYEGLDPITIARKEIEKNFKQYKEQMEEQSKKEEELCRLAEKIERKAEEVERKLEEIKRKGIKKFGKEYAEKMKLKDLHLLEDLEEN